MVSAIRYRELILKLIQQSSGHLTAEQIFLQAKEIKPAIVMATVYNNLAALVEDGLIRKVKVYGQADRYDKALSPHDHLICDRCGRLADITIGDFAAELEQKLGVHVESYELNVHYICEECAVKESSALLIGK